MLSKKQANKLWLNETIDLKYIKAREYVDNYENKWIKNKIVNWGINFLFIGWIINLIILAMIHFSFKTNADEENPIYTKIEKFCNIYWSWFTEKQINRCIKLAKAQTNFETWWICKNKKNNNCYNFRLMNKKYHKEFWVLWVDKSRFVIFKDKTQSIKYFAFHYFKYQYRKTIEQIVSGGCYNNLQWEKVCFGWFTVANKQESDNYIAFINNFK